MLCVLQGPNFLSHTLTLSSLKSEEPANRPTVTDCLQTPALDQRQTGSGVMSPWERRVGGGVGVNIGLIAH